MADCRLTQNEKGKHSLAIILRQIREKAKKGVPWMHAVQGTCGEGTSMYIIGLPGDAPFHVKGLLLSSG